MGIVITEFKTEASDMVFATITEYDTLEEYERACKEAKLPQ